jgi:hypothetical protein
MDPSFAATITPSHFWDCDALPRMKSGAALPSFKDAEEKRDVGSCFFFKNE